MNRLYQIKRRSTCRLEVLSWVNFICCLRFIRDCQMLLVDQFQVIVAQLRSIFKNF